MGNQNSNQLTALYHEHYDIHAIDQSLRITYLLEKSTQKEFILKQILVRTQIEMKELEQTLARKKALMHHHIVILKQYHIYNYKALALFKFPFRTLDDERSERVDTAQYFSENELWSIIASLILGFSYLQANNILYGPVSSKYIYVQATGVIKIGDPMVKQLITNIEALKIDCKGIYLSPEQINQTKYNSYKSDVFVLGIVMLELMTLKTQEYIYSATYQSINFSAITSTLSLCQKRYGQIFVNLIWFMLQQNPIQRVDWIQLERYVKGERIVNVSGPSNRQNSRTQNNITITYSNKQVVYGKNLMPKSPSQINSENRLNKNTPSNSNNLKSQPIVIYKQDTIKKAVIVKNQQYIQQTSLAENLPTQSNEEGQHQKLGQIDILPRYQGQYFGKLRHGFGKYYFEDMGVYVGNWVYNRMQGQGTLYYPSGSIAYRGQWQHDLFHGKGMLYNQKPSKLSSNNFNYGDFTELNDHWKYYQGDFEYGMRNGKGILVLQNHEIFSGNFKQNCIEGEGVFYSKEKQVSGIWQNNRLKV